ncbi:MAG TPA: Txe/YoeB family addiction module toxin [Prolixibacteraceae bacterium]|jgi:toxin YoeB|nr:Txe/YoeB family addiction module toxin [Prolixibacteraceae bacterium]
MEIEFSVQAEEDLIYWKRTHNNIVLKRIRALLENIIVTPCSGIGNPEALKYELSGKWSRRITKFDRLVYMIAEDKIYVSSLRGHYD